MQTCERLRTSIKPHPTQESATYIHFFQPLSFAPLHYLRDFHCRQNYNRASITSLDHLPDEFPEDSYWCLCSQARLAILRIQSVQPTYTHSKPT